MTDYATMQQQLNSLRKQMQESAKSAFEAGSKELFEKYPTVKAFAWKQYTPYFNDGDACVFGVHADEDSVEIEFADLPEDFEDEEARIGDGFATIYWMWEHLGVEWDDKKAQETIPALRAYYDVAKFIQGFEEDDLETMFGDHAQIIVRPEGIEVEEYSHD